MGIFVVIPFRVAGVGENVGTTEGTAVIGADITGAAVDGADVVHMPHERGHCVLTCVENSP